MKTYCTLFDNVDPVSLVKFLRAIPCRYTIVDPLPPRGIVSFVNLLRAMTRFFLSTSIEIMFSLFFSTIPRFIRPYFSFFCEFLSPLPLPSKLSSSTSSLLQTKAPTVCLPFPQKSPPSFPSSL
jgi:hypothetical protein